MRLILLILLTLLLPLAWGGAMYWLVKKCWPSRPTNAGPRRHSDSSQSRYDAYDYQI